MSSFPPPSSSVPVDDFEELHRDNQKQQEDTQATTDTLGTGQQEQYEQAMNWLQQAMMATRAYEQIRMMRKIEQLIFTNKAGAALLAVLLPAIVEVRSAPSSAIRSWVLHMCSCSVLLSPSVYLSDFVTALLHCTADPHPHVQKQCIEAVSAIWNTAHYWINQTGRT